MVKVLEERRAAHETWGPGALTAGRLRALPVTREPTLESPVRMDIHSFNENDQFKLAGSWRQHTFTKSHLSIFLNDILNVWGLQSEQIQGGVGIRMPDRRPVGRSSRQA